MKKIAEFIPHLSIALLLSLMVFTVLDGYNPLMQWLNSTLSKYFILVTCGVGLITAVMLIARQRRRRRRPKDDTRQ